jgi:hypothetical protein
MAAVETLRIDAVQVSHAVRKIGIRCFDDDVVLVGHLSAGMAAPVESLANLLEQRQPVLAVAGVVEDVLTAIAARCHVVEGAGEIDAKRPGKRRRPGSSWTGSVCRAPIRVEIARREWCMRRNSSFVCQRVAKDDTGENEKKTMATNTGLLAAPP